MPLESVVKFKETVGPQTINHSGQLPSVSDVVRPAAGRLARARPSTHIKRRRGPHAAGRPSRRSFEGSAKVFQQSMTNLGLLLFIAIGVVYIVLGMLYESYIHPITILSGLPSAGLGALVTLWLFGNELNIYSFVGLIMLIGIVKKNAIMQIDFALEAERQHGKTPAEAIYEGCLIRFRPIMMTTMAALLGARADRARLRRGRRSAATARPGGRRRPDGLAAHHALSHAGRLHLPGDDRSRRSVRFHGATRPRLCRHEYLRRIHQAADRHQPADGGDRALRRGRLPLAAGQRPAERRLPDAPRHGAVAGRGSRDDGASVATPLENQFSKIAGLSR